MIHKTLKHQGLTSINTTIYDTSDTSLRVLNVDKPSEFTSGKNSFSLLLNTDIIVIDSEIFIEIIDEDGDPIYYEVTDYIDNAGAVYISPVIYSDTPPGDCKITILATITEDANGAHVDITDTPNYKWEQIIRVIPERRNQSPIIFSTLLPEIQINELVKTYMDQNFGTTEFVTTKIGVVNYELINDVPTIQANGFAFVSDMVNGALNVTASNLTPEPNGALDSPYYTTEIKEVVSQYHAILKDRYEAPQSQQYPPYHIPTKFISGSFDLTYQTTPTYSLTENSRSFAHIQLDNVIPISGEIYRIKTSIKSAGTVGTYEVVDDAIILDSPYREKLIDYSADNIKTSMGEILNQDVVDTYWRAGAYIINNNIDQPDEIDVSNFIGLVYDENVVLPNSFEINETNDITYGAQYIKIENSSPTVDWNYSFKKGNEYKFILDVVATSSATIGYSPGGIVFPKMSVFISGSSFVDPNRDNKFGKLLAIFDTTQASQNGSTWRYDSKEIEFLVDEDGEGSLIFIVESGNWNIGSLSLFSNMDTGFSPENINLLVPIPTEHVDDKKDIKLEFYDSYGNLSDFILEYTNVVTLGGNTYIGGAYNLLTGSLYVGNGINSGVEIRGDAGGAIIRSIGYTGFNDQNSGFMMWSGSALSGSTDNYEGVGLEIYYNQDNFFKFKTQPSKFEVKTENFYFGNEYMFISGSKGSIEMKSGQRESDFFHLKNNSQLLIKKDGMIMLDTESGFSDAYNVGRHIFSLTTGVYENLTVLRQHTFSSYGPNSGSVDTGLASIGNFKFNSLPGETHVNVTYRLTTNNQDGRVILRLSNIKSGLGVDFGNSEFPFSERVHGYDTGSLTSEQSFYFKEYYGTTVSSSNGVQGQIIAVLPNELTGSIMMGQMYAENLYNGSNNLGCDSAIVTIGRELQSEGIGQQCEGDTC